MDYTEISKVFCFDRGVMGTKRVSCLLVLCCFVLLGAIQQLSYLYTENKHLSGKQLRNYVVAAGKGRPRRKIAVVGPHDRYNFGDLLFEKVVTRLLVDRVGYNPDEIISVGMVATNMSKYGGNENIIGIRSAVEMSQSEAMNSSGLGPFDVVFLGGQSLNCRFSRGQKMLPEELHAAAKQQKLSNCAYLFPKELLLPPSMRKDKWKEALTPTLMTKAKQPIAVVNSVSGTVKESSPCYEAVRSADFISFRDLKPGTKHNLFRKAQPRPDSAVMTMELFSNTIASFANTGEGALIHRQAPQHIAVQIKSKFIKLLSAQRFAHLLDEVWLRTNMTTVFFMAGSAAGHDSIELYEQIAEQMSGPSIIYHTEHVWSVVALISKALAIISSSLHVRILSFVSKRPRVTICDERSKHSSFISIWDADDSVPCVKLNSTIWRAVQEAMNTSQAKTEENINVAVQSYLQGFDQWSALLSH